MNRYARALASGCLACLCGAGVCGDVPEVRTQEPRAYGWQLGDVVTRTVTLELPQGLALDAASVPRPGGRGRALELRSVARRDATAADGARLHELTLDYQVFLSPREPRVLELPGLRLRLEGGPREQELRVEAWPLAVSPLAPVEVAYRRGLGELQPDAEPPMIDTRPARLRLAAYGAAALVLCGWLAHVYIGLPWGARRRRPFGLAWREVRALTPASAPAQWREAFRQVHAALNLSMGAVMFEQDIDRFLARRPQFAPLRSELATFFQRSRAEFFGAGPGPVGQAWLVDFCRRCRDAERGAA